MQYKADPTWLLLSLPSHPPIEAMHEWTVEQVSDFLGNVTGDLADKAKFVPYAPVLKRHGINGACLNASSHDWVRECRVPVGDQEALHRGLKILSRLHQASIEYLHLIRVTVEAASHLPKVDQYGLCDPYVLLKINNDVRGTTQEFCTTYKPKELAPTWKHQTFDIYVADLDDPGECIVRVMDHNLILQDQLVGCYLFGEVYCTLPKFAGCDHDEKPLDLSDILRKACSGLQRVQIPLFLDGKPLMGEDSERASVTLSFEVVNGGRKEIKLIVPGNQYPRSCLEATTHVNLVAKQYVAPVHGAPAGGPGSFDGANHQAPAQAEDDLQNRCPMTSASMEELKDVEDGLPVKDWNHDVQRDSALVVNEDYTRSAVVRVGRQIAAEIDSWFALLMPSMFWAYIVGEFGYQETKYPDSVFSSFSGSLSPTANAEDTTKLAFYDNRTGGVRRGFVVPREGRPAFSSTRLQSALAEMLHLKSS